MKKYEKKSIKKFHTLNDKYICPNTQFIRMKIPFIHKGFLHIKVFETSVTPYFCPKVELSTQNCIRIQWRSQRGQVGRSAQYKKFVWGVAPYKIFFSEKNQ